MSGTATTHDEPKDGGSGNQVGSASEQAASPIVQYILVRTDLEWGPGAMIAQACHASIAAVARTIESKSTLEYLKDLNNMHKVILRADKLEDLKRAEGKLLEANVPHHLWVEQPENVPSCLACSPQPKPLVQAIFKHFKLFR